MIEHDVIAVKTLDRTVVFEFAYDIQKGFELFHLAEITQIIHPVVYSMRSNEQLHIVVRWIQLVRKKTTMKEEIEFLPQESSLSPWDVFAILLTSK